MICDDMWWLVMRIYENWWVTVCGSRCISKKCSKVKVGKVGKRRAHEMHGMLCHFLSTWCWAWSLSKGPKSVCADVSPITSVQIAWKKSCDWGLYSFSSFQSRPLVSKRTSIGIHRLRFCGFNLRTIICGHTYDIFWYIILYIYNTGACDWRMMHN